jgi:hypothetical protein
MLSESKALEEESASDMVAIPQNLVLSHLLNGKKTENCGELNGIAWSGGLDALTRGSDRETCGE